MTCLKSTSYLTHCSLLVKFQINDETYEKVYAFEARCKSYFSHNSSNYILRLSSKSHFLYQVSRHTSAATNFTLHLLQQPKYYILCAHVGLSKLLTLSLTLNQDGTLALTLNSIFLRHSLGISFENFLHFSVQAKSFFLAPSH